MTERDRVGWRRLRPSAQTSRRLELGQMLCQVSDSDAITERMSWDVVLKAVNIWI